MPQRIASLASEMHAITRQRLGAVAAVSRNMKLLAINARIEAAHAGERGLGFGVVAGEIGGIAQRIHDETLELERQLGERAQHLADLGTGLVAQIFGTRLVDLAHNLIEIMDRNLYERTCDVRWWATEAAVVSACSDAGKAAVEACSRRLAVILRSYTVYSDILVLDRQGRVLASGRHPACLGQDLSARKWFASALATANGEEFSVDDVASEPALGGRLTAAFATAVRRDGEVHGEAIGVIAVLFDWEAQAQTVVDGVRLDAAERSRARCMIIDRSHLILAASDRRGLLQERLVLPQSAASTGWSQRDGVVLAWAETPGFETYRGQGWLGAIELHQ